MDIFLNILILMILVSLSGIAKRVIPYQLPLPLLQIAMGTIIAWPKFGLHINFNSELFMVLFIPPLLFVDGWKTPPSEFIKHRREIVGLALALVLLTVVGIGYLIYWIVPGIQLLPAFCLAAVLSPTDAVALSGIIGEGRIPKKIMAILQGEALMNDASGLVALKLAVAVCLGEMTFTFYGAIIEFIKIFIGGVTAGIIITLLYGNALRSMSRWTEEDPVTEIIFLLLLPFACSLIADCIELSGILAAVAAGMTVSKSGILHHAPLSMRLRANSVWSMLEFLFNGMVFILLGLQLPKIIRHAFYLVDIHTHTSMKLCLLFFDIVFIYLALLVLRFSWLFIMRYISCKFIKKHPLEFSRYNLRELLTASFAGVRGAITLAGVLSVPHFINFKKEFPARYELILLSTGVILFSLFIAMIVLPFLLRGVSTIDTFVLKNEIQNARSIMAQVAIESLYKMEDRLVRDTTENIDSELIKEVTSRVVGSLRRRLDTENNLDQILFIDNLERRFRLTGLRAERGEVYHLRATQKISDETMHKLLYELDLIEALLIENQ
ncbi:MAG: Na+/H+ antiporter [Candidatus Dasytiphilus stammeri]